MATPWSDAPEKVILPDDAVHVWCASLRVSPNRLTALEATLDGDERVRADQFHSREHRDRFVAGRGELRAILGAYTGAPPEALRFGYGRQGKPAIRAAMNRADLRFNLAHAGDLALYAVTRARELGVDLERIAPRENEALAERFFSPGEVAALRALPEASRLEAFYSCWTRKEAYLKATGDGLSTPLDQFEVAFGPARPPALLRVADAPLEPGRWSLAALDVAPGYAAALCVEGRGWSLTCWRRS
jgi:4'-phosphopantetheinyl transferase